MVEDADCGPPPVRVTRECDETIATRAGAIRALNLQPACTEDAIAVLQQQQDFNDLAAAYYVRAQRDDQPLDLVLAFEANEAALKAEPASSTAQFNRALILEALGLRRDALSLWQRLAAAGSSEAREHAERLERAEARSAAKRWERAAARLGPALKRGDVEEVRRLIAPFPVMAAGMVFHRPDATLAAALTQITGGPFTHDRLDLMARYGKVRPAPDDATLEAIEGAARAYNYRDILAFVHASRGFLRAFESRYLEALAEYDAAIDQFAGIGDQDNAAQNRTRRIGVLRAFGDTSGSWREAIATMRNAGEIVSPNECSLLYNETASTALELGHPTVALLFVNNSVRILREALAETPPADLKKIAVLQSYIASTRRRRAGIQFALKDYKAGTEDLNEAIRLVQDVKDKGIQRLLMARLDEARAQTLLTTNPAGAADAFSAAFEKASPEFLTFRASLLAQRGEALGRLGRNAESTDELMSAVDLLQKEETRALSERKRGQGEEYWRSYFARFDDSYRLLIRQFVALGRTEDAFRYSERQRALEVLDLVQQLGLEPKSLRDDINLAELQAALPTGTTILDYSVGSDRAIVWIISHDTFKTLSLDVSRQELARRVAAFEEQARAHDSWRAKASAYNLHQKLLAEPLRAIGAMPERLVFIPDGALHALPFAALLDPGTSQYLIERTVIETAGSAKLYLLSLGRDRELARNRRVLVMGNPAFEQNAWLTRGLKRLPAAEREAEALETIYGADAQTRMDENATIGQFRDLAPSCGVIHIAGHAIVNARTPSQSLLVLAPSGDDHGTLDTQQLLSNGKTLAQTRLVVLSACSSAGGLPIGPEGVAPLVRPLIGAGVPAVVGSVWNVDDATTEPLLVSFHRAYSAGSDAAAALQAAQLELLKGAKTGLKPVAAWAPFQVIGHASSPFASPVKTEKEKPP